MDPDTESLLISTCMALGGFEDVSEDMDDATQVYVMGDECLECLKDIKKFIKYFDEPGDNVVLTYLAKMGILEKELIPIIMLNTPADNPTRERLVLACIELIVPMTWIIDYKALQDMTVREEDTSIVGNLHQRVEILRGYKRAFLEAGVLQAVFAVMLKPLEVEYRLRTARDQAVIRLGLSLFRNLVAIPDSATSVTGTIEQFISSIMQEELLERFHREHIMALFITLASSSTDAQLSEWNALTLETFYYIFSGVDADELIPTVSGRVKNTQLQDLLNKEEREKQSQSTAGRKRHDRFGTTGEVRLQDGTRVVMHQKGALFASFENHLDNIKRARATTKRRKETEGSKSISKSGAVLLRNLALTFLESGFNPLFTSLRRDMDSQREKIRESHKAQYMSLMAFMLKFQRQYADYLTQQYHENKKNALGRQLEEVETEYQENFLRCDFDLITTAIEVTSVYHIVRFVREHNEIRPKDRSWEDIRKGVDCLQEILMTLNAMTKSQKEEYRDASAIVQSNLYYEEGALELVLKLTWKYRTQPIKYIQAVIRMIHILLKTLEGFSNSKSAIFIRKKKAIRKSKVAKQAEASSETNGNQQSTENVDQSQAVNEGERPTNEDTQQNGRQEQDQDEDDEQDEDIPKFTLSEHKFFFQEFERRFANESVLNIYFSFLEGFAELDEIQLHWVASIFHRVAVNCKNPVVFYKLSTLQLFHRILQSNKEDTKKDMIPFISYLLHQFFKKMQEYPLLVAEVFFHKPNKLCREINFGRDVVEMEKIVITEKKEKKLMQVELQVDQNLSEEKQIKVAVRALIDDGDDDSELVEWILELLKDAVAKRQLMQFRSESELEENPDLMYSVENVEDIPIVANNPMREKAIRLQPRFRLLLRLLKFVKEEVDNNIQYKIPKELPTDTISEYHDLVEAVYKEQGNIEYDFESLIQKINKSSRTSTSEGQQRQSGIVGEGRKLVEKQIPMYHSAEYILDSEDESDAYFENEKQLRKRTNIEFAEAEERKRRMDEDHARAARHRQQKKLSTKRFQRRRKEVLLTDDENDDEKENEGEMGEEEGNQNKPLFKSASDVEDSDDDGQSEKQQPIGRILIDRAIGRGSGNNAVGNTKPQTSSPSSLHRLPAAAAAVATRQQSSSQRKVVQLDSDDSEGEDNKEDENEPTQPLSLTQMSTQKEDEHEPTQPLSLMQMSTQTTSSKRRIILDDSEHEDEDGMQGDRDSHQLDNRPAKKRVTMVEDEDEDEEEEEEEEEL
ncbi:Topoisomerase 1-associated factor 1 [Modicella reniformis]|uniref:Topoisomerase 1-associated factor 1 n=1 Tax=Modicella reniformis TaxID=1440133 RepID=A0A9P6SPW9_9FUNG|nr:Topoisomerase 1-associated factor 1 [Modicella reniformis]